jgi:hypothetical protein
METGNNNYFIITLDLPKQWIDGQPLLEIRVDQVIDNNEFQGMIFFNLECKAIGLREKDID